MITLKENDKYCRCLMKKLLCILLCCVPVLLTGQRAKIDSLLNLLHQSPFIDTLRLERLNELADYYYYLSPDSGIFYADRAIMLADSLQHYRALATAYNHRGSNYWAKGEDTLAMKSYEAAYNIHLTMKNEMGQARVLNNIALINYNMAQYTEAIENHEKALAIFKAHQFGPGIINSYNNIGVNFMAMDDYPRALQSYLDILAITSEPAMIVNTLTNIGLVYKYQTKYPDAIRYYQQAFDIYQQQEHEQGKANVLGNMGVVYDLMGQYDTALHFFEQALAINRSIGNKRKIAGDLTNIGIVYKNTAQIPRAIEFLRHAISTYDSANDKYNQSIALNTLAQLYYTTASFENAGKLYHQAQLLADESGNMDAASTAWLGLSNLYEKTGRTSQALNAYKKHIHLRDSIYSREKEKELISKSLQFEFDKKEALLQESVETEKALSNAELKKQKLIRNIFALGSIFILVSAFSIYLLYKKRKDAEALRKEAELKTRIAEAEMMALRAQMNPHFIFNSLNAIRNLVNNRSLENADNYLSKFASLLRAILEHSGTKEIELAEDIQTLELYMQLESMRMKYPFTYNINIDPAIDPEITLIPPLLLQPFVENSIWHGIAPLQQPGKITIDIRPEEDNLFISIRDNGVGMQAAADHSPSGIYKKQSMGTSITRSRIALAWHDQDTQQPVQYIHHTDGLEVQLRLPLAIKF